jgi:hypothetical protein
MNKLNISIEINKSDLRQSHGGAAWRQKEIGPQPRLGEKALVAVQYFTSGLMFPQSWHASNEAFSCALHHSYVVEGVESAAPCLQYAFFYQDAYIQWSH